jgi:hypothetical protein
MIKIRVDVDYPYPSRAKSFLYVALRIKKRKSKNFLKNAQIIAKMINESPKEVKAYWFFTPYTIPNKELLDLLGADKHEVALHVATDPFGEWKNLEKELNRKVNYYTIHGTANYMAQLVWGRKLGQKKAEIPIDFPLKSFHDFTTYSFDMLCYSQEFEDSKRIAKEWIDDGVVLSMHPEWLFKKANRNRRGPYYEVLRNILE